MKDFHLDRILGENSVKAINQLHDGPISKQNIEISQIKWPKVGSLSLLKPMIDENKNTSIERISSDRLQELTQLVCENKPSTSKADVNIKLNDYQLELYSLLNSYTDLIYTNETHENVDDIRSVYVLHALRHLMNSRSRIITNNKVFEKKTPNDNVVQDDPSLRDQGFTRTKILFLLPFRYSALKLGKEIAKLLSGTHNVMHMDRFIQEFGDEDGVDSTTRPIASDGNKPADHYHTFHGNTDDSFRIGLKLTKKSIKFFSDFYDSDMIIASPLGLKTILVPDEQHALRPPSDSEQVPVSGDKDFLSSIEILVLDQAEVFLMQNWEHVLDIMQHINLMPSRPRKMDITRVRLWHLENWSKYYRQTLMFSSITVPLLHSFFQTFSLNYEGYLTLKQRVDNPLAKQISTSYKQHFLYYDSANAKDACDDRYTFFTRHVLPKFTGLDHSGDNKGPLGHTLIFVGSYFDYVRLRNYFRKEKLSFTQICEYTEENKVSKARQLFYFGARQFLLYTERCHFYHRYKIKGIRNIIFYEPPQFPKFYTEMLKMLELQGKKYVEGSGQFSATTLFTNHDTLQMGAIIGFCNAVKLIQNKKSIT